MGVPSPVQRGSLWCSQGEKYVSRRQKTSGRRTLSGYLESLVNLGDQQPAGEQELADQADK